MSSGTQPTDAERRRSPNAIGAMAGPRGLPTRCEVVILGAGPAGLETALALRAEGLDVHVLEAGRVGTSIVRWGHVRMFSPWSLNTSHLGRATLGSGQRHTSETACPTGSEFVSDYLEPIARSPHLTGRVHEGVRAVGATRQGTLKGEWIGSKERRRHPFRIVWELIDANGPTGEGVVECRFLVDATGVLHNPNSAGDGGVRAPGESQSSSRIWRDLAVTASPESTRLRDRRVLVLGGGYSAATAVISLLDSSPTSPRPTSESTLHWAFRSLQTPITEIDDDPLPERRSLRDRARAVATSPPAGVTIHSGVVVERFAPTASGVRVTLRVADGSERTIEVDEVLSLTGYRPDPRLLSELQVHHCYATDGLMKVSAHLLSAGGGSDCLAVTSGGLETLRSPEPDLFVLGSKSYGRSSQYLLRTGIEQAEAVASELCRVAKEEHPR